MADVGQLKAVGAAFVDLIEAIRDGVSLEDLVAIQALMAAGLTAADDIQEDWDSAVLDIIAGAAGRFATIRRRPEVVDGA